MATYQSTIIADSPKAYFRLDEGGLSSSSRIPNLGTFGGDAGLTGNIGNFTTGQAPAGYIDGYSWAFASSQGYVSETISGLPSGKAFTLEVWFKRNMGYSGLGGVLQIAKWNNAYIGINSYSTGQVLCYDGSSYPINQNFASVIDGNWHHLALTYDGSYMTLYIDGVSQATGYTTTPPNLTAATFSFGGVTNAGMPGWLDEPAFYNSALTATQIQNHYTTGTNPPSVSITATAPAMTASIMTPVAAVTAIKANVSNTATAMTASISAPVPVVKASKTVTVAAPASSLSITAAGATLKLVTQVTQNGFENTSGGGTTVGMSGTYPLGFSFPAPVVPSGYYIESATFGFVGSSDGVELRLGVATNFLSGTDTNRARMVDSTGQNFSTGSPIYYNSATIPLANSNTTTQFNLDATATVNSDDYKQYGNIVMFIPGAVGAGLNVRPAQVTLTYSIAPKPVMSPTITPTPISLSLFAPDAVIHGGATVLAVAGSVSISAPLPVIAVTKNASVQATAMSMFVTAPAGKSFTPDFTASAGAMDMSITTPAPNQFISVNKVIVVNGAMGLGMSESDSSIDMTTERIVRVPNPMILSTRAVGIYTGNSDRYFTALPATADLDDIWYKMDETSGTTAIDALVDQLQPALNANGAYIGNVELSASGPQGRRAVHFDGTSWLNFGTFYDTFTSMDATVEFSIRTTQQNGVIFTGGATSAFGANAGPSTSYIYTNPGEVPVVRLVNGEVVIDLGTAYNTVYKTRTKINDGEWHHVVLSVPYQSTAAHDAYNLSSFAPFFMMIDGKVVWSRHTSPLDGQNLLPVSFMARGGKETLAGDLSSVIVRSNYAVSEDTALSLYYEWSNTIIVHGTPMAIGINAVDPIKARGNTKRMLCLYGLPLTLSNSRTRDGSFNYISVWAGFNIPSTDSSNPSPNSNLTAMRYWNVKSFQLDDFLVFPAAIMHQPGSGGGPFSAAGIENGEYYDRYEGAYIDDETGLPRFIDLQKDLREDITAFDAITAVNYPAPYPIDGPTGSSAPKTFEPRQHNMGLNDGEWDRARNKLRDSILEAAYEGVSLWITEPEMALNLGFIEGYDKHDTGVGYGDDQLGYNNWAAAFFDIDHFVGTDEQKQRQLNNILPGKPGVGRGRYSPTWQANAQRVVINEQEGITDLSSYDYGDMVSFKSNNAWEPHSTWYAYDIIDVTDGLIPGQYLGIQNMGEVWGLGDTTSGLGSPQLAGGYADVYDLAWNPRLFIVSARPDGIAGKPLTKEVDWYFGQYAAEIDNPYKDNIYTIASERGTVVRGRPIAGRAFIEFMDTSTSQEWISADSNPTLWNGRLVGSGGFSNWSFDTRRQLETLSFIEYTLTTSQARGGSRITYKRNVQDPYIISTPNDEFDLYQYWSMNARGLSWLAEDNEMADGDVLIYSTSMKVNVSAGPAVTTANRNIVEPVNGAMRLDVEMRHPANYLGNDVEERALPMVLNIKMNGIGTTVMAKPMALTITAPVADGRGERESIFIYMDDDRNITLYIKEDS